MRLNTRASCLRSLAIAGYFTIASFPLFALNSQANPVVHSDASQSERERQLHDLEYERRKNPGKKEEARQLAVSQLREDFSRLYALQQTQISPAAKVASFDYKTLATATEEINTRALRIRQNLLLMLSKRDDKKKKETVINENDLPASFAELSDRIVKFVNSPVFQVHSPNDNELRIQAREDLEGIIKLSDGINKAIRKLAKLMISNDGLK